MRFLAATIAVLCLTVGAGAAEPEFPDLEALNASIGPDYEAVVPATELVDAALAHRLVVYGEVHDQPEAVHNFLALVDSVRRRSPLRLRIGVEFVDRGDWDILGRYLQRALNERAFLARLMPTSMLLLAQAGPAHLEVLRYARRHRIDIVPLESPPSGARPLLLRNAEIRWNLASFLGRHADERLLVLYGVHHVLAAEAITEGLEVPALLVTSYGDSVLETFRQRQGRYPDAGDVLRLRPAVYLQAVGGEPRQPQMFAQDLGAQEELLASIVAVYAGDWSGIGSLVEALGDADVRWRRASYHALRNAAQRSFGYDPEAEPAARSGPMRRWRTWWERCQARLAP